MNSSFSANHTMASPDAKSSAESVHSKIGASSMKRWAACPGSVKLCTGIESTSSSYAEEGTLAHEIAAARLLEQSFTYNLKDIPDGMMSAVSVYVSAVKELWSGAKTHPCSFIKIEHKFDLSTLHPGLFGTSDCVIYDARNMTLYVLDYKHGAGIPVEVVDNEQLLYYALGALISTNISPTKICLGIVQPRCFHEDGPIRLWELDTIDLLDFEARLIEAAKATEDPNAPLNPGEHCMFCPGKGICPALHKSATELAKIEFKDPLKYDPNLLGEVLNRLPELEAFIKGVNQFAYQEALAGRPPPGWKLVQKRATRKWRDEKRAAEFLTKDLGLPEGDIYDLSLLSPAQIEKQISKDQKKMLSIVTVSESSGLTLAPSSDKREEVRLDAKSQFSVIEDKSSGDLTDLHPSLA